MERVIDYWRITVFGQAKGPWRTDKRLAQQDAIDLGLGSYGEWGVFYTTVPGDIQWRREERLRLRA